MAGSFVHLNIHSEFSLSSSTVRISDAVAMARECSMPALGMADNANIFGQVKFFKSALASGIKPLLGAEMWLQNEEGQAGTGRLSLLVKDAAGYRNLCELITRSYRQGQHAGSVCVSRQWLSDCSEGLIALSGGAEGELGYALQSSSPQRTQQLLDDYLSIFDDRFYIEIRRLGKSGEEEYVQSALDLAQSAGVPLVATNDVNFLKPDDFRIHEIRVCIHEGRVLGDGRRPRNFSEEQYFKNAGQMEALFEDIPEAISNTMEIARRCSFAMELGTYHLPHFSVSAESSCGTDADPGSGAWTASQVRSGRGTGGQSGRVFQPSRR